MVLPEDLELYQDILFEEEKEVEYVIDLFLQESKVEYDQPWY